MRNHGSIIARENGIPCVAGVPDGTRLIVTGNLCRVYGCLGLVIIDKVEILTACCVPLNLM